MGGSAVTTPGHSFAIGGISAGLLVAASLVCALPAPAHTRSVSYSTWELDPQGATVTLRITQLELTRPWAVYPEVIMYSAFFLDGAPGDVRRDALLFDAVDPAIENKRTVFNLKLERQFIDIDARFRLQCLVDDSQKFLGIGNSHFFD